MSTYTPESLAVCKKVVRSINAASGIWGPKCVVIGGLVPALLKPNPPVGLPLHIGTTDVDLGIQVAAAEEEGELYRTLKSVLVQLQFRQTQPSYCWARTVDDMDVKLELFCPVNIESSGGLIQNKPCSQSGSKLSALGIYGLDLIDRDLVTIDDEGPLLDDVGVKLARVSVCGPAMLLLLKAWALEQRAKGKDGYDIVWCLKAWGEAYLADRFREAGYHRHAVGMQALEFLERNFETADHTGPQGWVTSAGLEGDEREREKRDAAGIVGEFCTLCRK